MSSTHSLGQLAEPTRHHRECLGGPQGQPFRGGGLQITALRIKSLASGLSCLFIDTMEGILSGSKLV